MGLETVELPMFPLGSVLLPFGVLPLHIFEPRYQQLLNAVLEDDRRFGVVLISRGSEVGGGETRHAVGTIARIDEHQRFDDGRAAVVARGTTRLEVVDWLVDDPYPRAVVTELAEIGDPANDDITFHAAQSAFTAVLDVAHRLGRIEQIPEVAWAPDLNERVWQLAEMAPLSAHDRYRVLAEPTRQERLVVLAQLLEAVREDLALLEGLDDP